uniref:Uncharacterized protein n=1 Tax=Riboviria sp. TaxID=2585031 RepID=A0A6M3YNY3_9VIRU|nr:MAG: hypothetical protein 3 [Riboviria sp.]
MAHLEFLRACVACDNMANQRLVVADLLLLVERLRIVTSFATDQRLYEGICGFVHDAILMAAYDFGTAKMMFAAFANPCSTQMTPQFELIKMLCLDVSLRMDCLLRNHNVSLVADNLMQMDSPYFYTKINRSYVGREDWAMADPVKLLPALWTYLDSGFDLADLAIKPSLLSIDHDIHDHEYQPTKHRNMTFEDYSPFAVEVQAKKTPQRHCETQTEITSAYTTGPVLPYGPSDVISRNGMFTELSRPGCAPPEYSKSVGDPPSFESGYAIGTKLSRLRGIMNIDQQLATYLLRGVDTLFDQGVKYMQAKSDLVAIQADEDAESAFETVANVRDYMKTLLDTEITPHPIGDSYDWAVEARHRIRPIAPRDRDPKYAAHDELVVQPLRPASHLPSPTFNIGDFEDSDDSDTQFMEVN